MANLLEGYIASSGIHQLLGTLINLGLVIDEGKNTFCSSQHSLYGSGNIGQSSNWVQQLHQSCHKGSKAANSQPFACGLEKGNCNHYGTRYGDKKLGNRR